MHSSTSSEKGPWEDGLARADAFPGGLRSRRAALLRGRYPPNESPRSLRQGRYGGGSRRGSASTHKPRVAREIRRSSFLRSSARRVSMRSRGGSPRQRRLLARRSRLRPTPYWARRACRGGRRARLLVRAPSERIREVDAQTRWTEAVLAELRGDFAGSSSRLRGDGCSLFGGARASAAAERLVAEGRRVRPTTSSSDRSPSGVGRRDALHPAGRGALAMTA